MMAGRNFMMNKINNNLTKEKNLKQLNMGFAFLFLLAGSLQQFITVHFGMIGKPELGFKLLLTLYLSVFITNIFVHKIIGTIGEKRSIVLSSICYLCAGFASCQQAEFLLYTSFGIMGFGCALIWNAQNSVFLDNSASESLGKNAGTFNMYLWSGCFAGIVLFGLALKAYSFEYVVFVFTCLASISLLYFIKITDSFLPSKKVDKLSDIVKQRRYIIAAIVSAKSYFLYGLAISFIPFITSQTYENTLYVAVVSLVFFMAQAFCSKPCGTLVDRYGTSKLLFAGAITSLLGFILLIFSLHWIILVLSAFFLGLSSAMLIPVTMLLPKVIAPQKEQAAVVRLLMFGKYTGIIVAITLSTWGSIHDVLIVSIIASCLFLFVSKALCVSHIKRESYHKTDLVSESNS
ncbi:MFS transporter [Thalassotalea castellviae]|uniref:MFS transporter n=1 Tax=Thalassotalea castellviae TaxID=3075612 RepID=A0ABU3A2Y3_9GAMM|nr:MFS transporter [Thalassotalea sp. W431]MDT0604305.1 MFS transporter [Thalassotalea sp. W431]